MLTAGTGSSARLLVPRNSKHTPVSGEALALETGSISAMAMLRQSSITEMFSPGVASCFTLTRTGIERTMAAVFGPRTDSGLDRRTQAKNRQEESTMISKTLRIALTMVLASFALSSAAWAATCSNASLSGTYGFLHGGTDSLGTCQRVEPGHV